MLLSLVLRLTLFSVMQPRMRAVAGPAMRITVRDRTGACHVQRFHGARKEGCRRAEPLRPRRSFHDRRGETRRSNRVRRNCGEGKGFEEEVDPPNPLTRTFDFILSTVPDKHGLNLYLPLLKRDATMAICGDLGPLEQSLICRPPPIGIALQDLSSEASRRHERFSSSVHNTTLLPTSR